MNYINASQDAKIEKSFEQLFDYFRSTNLQSEEYFVALYLLYLYYKEIDLTSVEYDYIASFNTTNIDSQSRLLNKDQVFELNQVFRPALEILGINVQNVSNGIFKNIDHKILEDNFPRIFDRLLYRLLKSQGRFSGEIIMPEELSRFMCSLVELPANAKIYNPFAGLASIGVLFDGGQDYIGQELNHRTWAIGALRILVHDNNHSHFIHGDSIQEWIGSQEFDLIISNPPFGLRLKHIVDGHFGRIRSAELFIVENGLAALKQKGKMILCVPKGLLFELGTEQNFRMHLIENDLLEMVISLPSGLLMNAGLATAIIVINKDKKEKGKVRFVEAKSFVESSPSKEKKLDHHKLNSVIWNSIDTEVLRIVSNETIAANDFNLNVPRYN